MVVLTIVTRVTQTQCMLIGCIQACSSETVRIRFNPVTNLQTVAVFMWLIPPEGAWILPVCIHSHFWAIRVNIVRYMYSCPKITHYVPDKMFTSQNCQAYLFFRLYCCKCRFLIIARFDASILILDIRKRQGNKGRKRIAKDRPVDIHWPW